MKNESIRANRDTGNVANTVARWFGDYTAHLCCTVSNCLNQLNTGGEYDGLWWAYKATNGAVFIAPAYTGRESYFTLQTASGFTATVPPLAAGIVACLHAYSRAQFPAARDHYDRLLAFARQRDDGPILEAFNS